MKRIYTTILLLALATLSGAQLQSSVERPCPGENVTFTCTVSSLAHRWEASGLDMPRSVTPRDQGGVIYDPPFQFNVTEVIPLTSITSTATVTATAGLNSTLIVCQDGLGILPDQSSIINIRGPPSVPTLSCVDLSEDVSGAVNVTVSWTLSGGDSADFYLINITTNAPQSQYGGLLIITNASVTQHVLTGFMAGYEYNITVRGVNCDSQEGRESEPLTITPQVPNTPDNVIGCVVYDKVNRTIQITEATWNEPNPVTISGNCAIGQNIRASYELTYVTDSGTPIATCVVNGTDCSNGTCRHELRNNTADSRCHPPVPQFSGEGVTVSVTAKNMVGESNISESRSLNGTNVNILDVRVDSTDPSNAFVDCAFNKVGYNCTIQYGTDPSYTNLTDEDTSSTVSQNATITLTQQLESNTNYYYIVSAENSSQCVKVRGRFRTECTVTDLGGSEIIVRGGTVDQRCIDRGFASNTSISGGVVCYSGTMNGSTAVYVCDNNTQSNEVTRVCQSDGTWNGTIPSCPVSRRLERWHISLIVIGAVALLLSMLLINLPCRRPHVASAKKNLHHSTDKVKWVRNLLLIIAAILWVIGVAVWIAVGVVMSKPPNENVREPNWRSHRDALINSAFAVSILAIISTAAVVCVHVCYIRKKGERLGILLIMISTIFWVIGVIFWCAVGYVVSNPPDGDTRDPVWQLRRDAVSYTGLAISILATVCTAAVVWVCVWHSKKVFFKRGSTICNNTYKKLKILLIVISTVSWIIGVALWCTVGVVVVSPPDGNMRDQDWQHSRNGLVISAFIVSIIAFICAAVVVWPRMCCNRNGVDLMKKNESKEKMELSNVKDKVAVGSTAEECKLSAQVQPILMNYADVGPHMQTAIKAPPPIDNHVQYSLLVHGQQNDPAGTLSNNVEMTHLSPSPLDTEDSPPPPPPKQFSADDTLQFPKLLESREPHQNEMDALYPPSPKGNQGDNTLQLHPPNTHQQTVESKKEGQK